MMEKIIFEKIIFSLILIFLISSPAFSGQILTYPKSIEVVRGSNVSFNIFVSNTDETGNYTSWIVGEKYICQPTKLILKNGEVGNFKLTYISKDFQIGQKIINVAATKAPTVKINVLVLPNDRDKRIINDTFWHYTDEVNEIRDFISKDKNATSNGMFDLTNIVIAKLWNINCNIKNGNYYEAYRILNDVKPQIMALKDYTKAPAQTKKSGQKTIYIIMIIFISSVILVIIIFELLKHFL